ncbi:hypothetical protein [Rouxiella badensis]|uniref:hypothetical protein n=1 Tax=Rouxiella badensis TaxID=1646377 RepID=UPI002AD531D9|nr:hypothetical protein [Rouxiella badensis]
MSYKISEREQFEEFMRNKFGDSVDLMVCKNGDGEYMAWDAQVAEAAFNAGRRAAKVKAMKFPKDMQMSDAVKANISSDFMDGYNIRGVMDRKAVEAAGINVLSADPVAECPPAGI